MGSGILIRRAISKYGKEKFQKEILFVFDNEDDMNDKEKELVVIGEQSYNLCEGGKGGFGYINSNTEIIAIRDKPEYKRLGATAANKIGANIKGSKKHFDNLDDPEYYRIWKEKVELGKAKRVRHDCPHCVMKQLDPGNYARHLKAKHSQ